LRHALGTGSVSRPDQEGRSSGRGLSTAAGIAALGVATFVWVRATNFRGYDEWVIASLLSRGVLSFPYADRPLNLLWALPAWILAPDRLWGFLFVHAAWLTLAGILTALLVRRLLPGATTLAFLAGAFTVVWMPSEKTRLVSVQMILYSGCTVGTLLSLWLLVEAWWRRRLSLAVLASACALATALSLEAALSPLLIAPVLLLFVGGWEDKKRWFRWTLGWLALITAAVLRIVVPMLHSRAAVTYQTDVLALAPSPVRLVRHVLSQLGYHLVPLADAEVRELGTPAVPLVVIVFVAGFLLATRPRGQTDGRAEAGRGELMGAGLLGLIFALLGYLPFMLTRVIRGPVRTQFLAAPGVGLLLGAGVLLLASMLPARARPWVACLLGVWVAAVGTGRTMALQREWTVSSAYSDQRRMLLEMTALVPDVKTHTLIVLLQDGGVWSYDFSFSHAVSYLYERRGRGHVAGIDSMLCTTRFDADGVMSEPLSILRGPWHEEVTRYRYDELVVLGEDPRGGLSVLDTWPAALPALPAGAVYAPRLRIVTGGPRLKRLKILDPDP